MTNSTFESVLGGSSGGPGRADREVLEVILEVLEVILVVLEVILEVLGPGGAPFDPRVSGRFREKACVFRVLV